MAIPEFQLATWSNQGAATTAAQTYNSIKEALARSAWPAVNAPEIYLQGSYRNDTNIYSESDVDVVVQIRNTLRSDVSALPPLAQHAHGAAFQNATYLWNDGRRDAIAALVAYYGSAAVKPGNKAIKVQTPYRMADVVVAIEHRKYSNFISATEQRYVSGIAVWVQADNDWIVNFPRQHYDNGVAKNAQTSGRFKPTTRVFKNANRYMVERNLLAAGVAPSYAIECLVYSAPHDCFQPTYQETFCNVVNWAHENIAAIRRVSEQGPMIGTGQSRWEAAAARSYINGLISLWNNWT
ncbi:MAG: hypothetical protein JWR16_2893 [Nevskia sp.]|nr:hypothetical protein [Nevskia sp.]